MCNLPNTFWEIFCNFSDSNSSFGSIFTEYIEWGQLWLIHGYIKEENLFNCSLFWYRMCLLKCFLIFFHWGDNYFTDVLNTSGPSHIRKTSLVFRSPEHHLQFQLISKLNIKIIMNFCSKYSKYFFIFLENKEV